MTNSERLEIVSKNIDAMSTRLGNKIVDVHVRYELDTQMSDPYTDKRVESLITEIMGTPSTGYSLCTGNGETIKMLDFTVTVANLIEIRKQMRKRLPHIKVEL